MHPRLVRLMTALIVGLGAALGPAGAEQPTGSVLDQRLASFLAGGYDPLTAPVGWHAPKEAVPGAFAGDLPVRAGAERTISTTALEAAAAYAERHDSLALIVVRGGAVELERYWRGAGRDTFFNPQSMSKTLIALLAGIAIAEGDLGGADDRLDEYLERLAGDPRGAITLKNLLQMSAGLAQITDSYEVTPDNPGVVQHFGEDFIEPIFSLALADPPGARWEYNNNESNLLAHVLTLATGRRYADYLSEKLWRPLGLRDAAMYLDRPGGAVMASCCVFSRPMDWARIGMLIRDRGTFGGRQLVPAAWIDEMTTPAETWEGYGYQIWLGDRFVAAERPDSPDPNFSWMSEPYEAEDMVVLFGHGRQRVWISPSADLVIVRAGRVWSNPWDEAAIPNTILRGLR